MIGAILSAGELLLGVTSSLLKNKQQRDNSAATKTAAVDAFNDTSRSLAMRQDQEALSAAQQVHSIAMDSASRRGVLASNAGSAGVEGATVDALNSDIMSSEYNARDIVDRNLTSIDQQIDQQRIASINQMNNRIAGAPEPSDLATGAQIGGSLAAFGYDWLRMQGPNEKVTGAA